MDASVGATVVLRCEPPFSNPAPRIQWKKDGAVLPTDSRVTILPTGNLYILNVTQADSGDYQCMATNLVSDARRRSEIATLTITGVCVCNEGGGGGEGRWLGSSKQQFDVYGIGVEGWSHWNAIDGRSSELP